MALPVAGNPILAADITRPWYIRKAASETRTSTAVASNDADFVNIALPVGVFEVHTYLTATGPAAGDVRVQWTFSGTATVGRSCWGAGPSMTTAADAETMVSQAITFTSAVRYGVGTNATAIQEHMFIEVTVAGNLTMQWSQFVSDASVTTLSSTSRLIISAVEAWT